MSVGSLLGIRLSHINEPKIRIRFSMKNLNKDDNFENKKYNKLEFSFKKKHTIKRALTWRDFLCFSYSTNKKYAHMQYQL